MKAQKRKNALVVIGVLMALILFTTESVTAQDKKPHYKCTPCGCSQDDVLVAGPGNCSSCGMKLINIHNPDEGLAYNNLNSAQVCELLENNPNVILLDVRSEGEFTQKTSQIGRFKNAINIPVNQIADRLDKLGPYREKTILVYCSISARSPRASAILAENGFTKIKNLMGGLNAWNEQSLEKLPCRDTHTTKQ
ncbi:rhodanese-like domain-containing protein [Roseivirga sp. E12]|uniref:rhodanese-like domain-containing protein n=1 Tax=Roseivirga sp. E12 TaxID=2819237 RepID=UPI001ABC38A3|nr:rhodanese-like domain-containing protein [Roseivirga sp. E12]MBO3698052.1 rhodanese-like domain-containing protein [Roseivirga sp. E12]